MTKPTGANRPLGRQLKQLLENYPELVQTLTRATRSLVLSVIPDAEEMIDPSAKLVGFGFGSRYSDLICTIIFSRSGVKLGIVRGAELEDPEGLLQGTGKVHKHIPLLSDEDVVNPGVRGLLETALGNWQSRQE